MNKGTLVLYFILRYFFIFFFENLLKKWSPESIWDVTSTCSNTCTTPVWHTGYIKVYRCSRSTPADNTRKRVWQFIEKEKKKEKESAVIPPEVQQQVLAEIQEFP